MKYVIREYLDSKNKSPYRKWLNKLDPTTKFRTEARILKLQETGHMGEVKALKDRVFELKFSFGAGIRIYFGRDGDKIILLLLGGDKSTQSKDIEKAKEYLHSYFENEKIRRT